MTALAWLIPAALALGALGLAAFVWALSAGQFHDLDGAAWRALEDHGPDRAPDRTAGTDTPDAMAAPGSLTGSRPPGTPHN